MANTLRSIQECKISETRSSILLHFDSIVESSLHPKIGQTDTQSKRRWSDQSHRLGQMIPISRRGGMIPGLSATTPPGALEGFCATSLSCNCRPAVFPARMRENQLLQDITHSKQRTLKRTVPLESPAVSDVADNPFERHITSVKSATTT